MRRSKPITWDQIRVGIVLIFGLVVLAVGVFFIGEVGDVFSERYRLVTLMESASGLQPGAVVQVAGRNVGQVERVEFIPPATRGESDMAIAIWMGVNVSVREQIRHDSRARVRTLGLLGDRIIDIEPGSADFAALAPGDTVESAPALSFDELLGEAADAVRSLTDLSNGLGATLTRVSDGEGSLGRLLVDETLYEGLVELNAQLGTVLGPVAKGEGLLGRLLGDEAIYDRLLAATARLDTVTGAMASGEGTLGRLFASDSLYRALASSATRADSLLGLIEGGEGAIGRLVGEDVLYEELLKVVVDLNAFLAEVRANPGRFIPPVRVF
ncbi:MlaD family protein [Candidatus Palauibacter sp.]|uniref:MlaD family protein n=1 Tax=Candidatus Palauibacter sp. TaxID=3101350 RepID=UPI003B5AE291